MSSISEGAVIVRQLVELVASIAFWELIVAVLALLATIWFGYKALRRPETPETPRPKLRVAMNVVPWGIATEVLVEDVDRPDPRARILLVSLSNAGKAIASDLSGRLTMDAADMKPVPFVEPSPELNKVRIVEDGPVYYVDVRSPEGTRLLPLAQEGAYNFYYNFYVPVIPRRAGTTRIGYAFSAQEGEIVRGKATLTIPDFLIHPTS